MKTVSVVADKMSKWFRVSNAPSLVIKPLEGAEMTMIHVSRTYPVQDASVVIPDEDAFLVVLYLKDAVHSDIVPGSPPSSFRLYPEGSICLLDLAGGAAISVRGSLEALAIHLPREHLAELTQHTGETHVDDLAVCRGRDDPTVRDIGAALVPLIARPDVDEALLSHIALALNAHLAHRYGRSRRPH